MAAATAAPLLVDLLPLPKVPPIVSEIMAGILIGPVVLNLVDVTAPLQVFAQIGLVFLFFLAGLEIAFDARDERHLGLVGLAFLASLGLALVVALIFDAVELVGAPLLVAIILAATSFGIVVAVLKDAGQTNTPFGQLVIAGASIADFATVIMLSLFFSSSGASFETTLVLLLLFLGVVAVVGLALAGARGSEQLKATVTRLHRTSAQISVRIAFLLLAVLVYMSSEFGLEVVLGAFLAGAMVSLLDREKAVRSTGLQEKLEAIGFGIFIPIFFVVSGAKLNLGALFDSVDDAVLVPVTVIALLIVRGVPALFYRRFVPTREVLSAALLQATSLSFVVAATQIGVELGKLDEGAAAGLVTGGVISVLLFPALALRLLGPVDQDYLLQARQMQAMSFAVHIPLVCFGIAFPAMVLFVEGLWLRTGDPVYKALAKRWSKVLLILFAVGVVTGTILSFELGLLWPNFMATFGDVFGLAFALEGFSFFIEAIFIAIYVYGWDRISPRAHFAAGIPVALAGITGSLMVISVNGWMNAPGGFEVVDR